MLKQLARLSVETDGRYATDSELEFLCDYLESVELRLQTYEKIRDKATNIVDEVENKKRAAHPEWFTPSQKKSVEICKRDFTEMLRITAAAVLLNDLDHLRNDILIWYQTIVRAYKYQNDGTTTYSYLENVLKQYLDDEELGLVKPALHLERVILG